jgi:hypothetical protein
MATQISLHPLDHASQDTTHDRVLTVSRVLSAIIVPVLIAAFLMLYLFPNDTGRLFAWPVKPPMTAMMLGATYLGGAYFFTRVVFARRWHTVRMGFLPVSAFAGILGIATLLHWDKFTHGHLSFELWALLYFTLPLVIPIIWYLNQGANRGNIPVQERLFFGWLRLSMVVVGGILLLAGIVLLIFPQWMIPVWPWPLTPLTARVLAAMFTLPALVSLGIAYDGRWSTASIIFQSQAISILLILVAMARATGEIQWNRWGSWTFPAGLLLVLLLIGLAALQTRSSG